MEDFVSQDKALVRELVERIDGVSRTWFELEIEGSSRKKTLVVEVNFDLDPNRPGSCGRHAMRLKEPL
jgi:hypothetical protein